ncbi:MAG: signal peptidase I [Lachnospiraceae bacterium]|nr:signal peptidase I [Lachnospiraceae bacterium]MDD7023531.1 signal peptidase I [Oscillospiraceae bacterium]MDY5541537.1 signal peptidase I [Lachnospiraceae bacterium]MDY5648386.1 signal peptidase I [Lachnospiraceae bacterium]
MRRKRRRYGARRKEKKINMHVISEILMWVFQIAVVLAFAFVIVYYAGEQISNIGDSMSPALENGDVVLVNRFIYKVKSPQMGDLIVFKPNGNENSHYYIKRVVAGPGDTVQIKEGFLYVNDELVTDLPVGKISNAGMAEEPVSVEKDTYFVIGDNPNSSEDSRYADIGNVNLKDIEGKPWYVLSPKQRRGRLK